MRGHRVDANHQLIRDGLRAKGYAVTDFSIYGGGIPDLAVALFPGVPYFLEVKDGEKPLSAQALTPAQEKWHNLAWQMTDKVRSLAEAIEKLDSAALRFAHLDIRP